MDLWVFAAVAGAGCLARYWNKLSKNGDSSFHLSSQDSNFENPESPMGNDVSLDRRGSDVNSVDGLFACNIGLDSENVRCFRKSCNESDVLSVSKVNDIGDGNEQSSNVGCGSCDFLLRDMFGREAGSVHNPYGNKKFLKTKHLYGNVSRPLNSIESCLMAQLCKEHAKIEEYMSSPSTSKSSFLVDRDNGNQMSRANDDDSFSGLIGSEEYSFHREAGQEKDENVVSGVPSLPEIGSFKKAKKMKSNAGNEQSGRSSSSSNLFSGEHVHTQHDATFLFSLGISFGMITTILANKREMDKLRELLKQTENMVQDLHEELEMKDSMTVKELRSENYGSQDTCDHSFCDKELNGFSPEKHIGNSPIIDSKKLYDHKEEECSESMSRIEAELEAELERLGLNMNEASLEGTVAELVEFDPDFTADFAQGELQTDVISGKDFDHPKLTEDTRDTMIFPVNYAVSPYELSLRLHEVIQSRLEERVQELEIALQNSHSKIRFMESKHEDHSQKYFSHYGQASPFTKVSLLTNYDCDPMAEPLVTSLSGEAPSAFNYDYEELIKIYDDSEDNCSSSGIHNTEYKVGSSSHDLHVLGVNEERLSRELSSGEVTMLKGQYELNEVNGDENCDFDYEEERQLIRQIVERSKKGSPVLQNARRILYSMDEDEN